MNERVLEGSECGVCEHNCEVNEETMRPNASHFLDCPVWSELLTRD